MGSMGTRDTDEFPWPSVATSGAPPTRSHGGFDLGGRRVAVLSYETGTSAWTDDLTSFHEDTAGDAHPIDLGSRRRAIDELRRNLPREKSVLLEVGCSSGFMLRELRRAFPESLVIGSDYVKGPLEKLAKDLPEVAILHFNLVKCPLPDDSIDGLVSLNVLEHIEDHEAALAQMLRILRPGGVAIIEVPAAPELFDAYDKALMHFRRYRLGPLRRMAESTGFAVLRASHLGFLVYPGFWIAKKKNRLRPPSGPIAAMRRVADGIKKTKESFLLSLLMDWELRIGRRMSYPLGIRCVLTCRKPMGSRG